MSLNLSVAHTGLAAPHRHLPRTKVRGEEEGSKEDGQTFLKSLTEPGFDELKSAIDLEHTDPRLPVVETISPTVYA